MENKARGFAQNHLLAALLWLVAIYFAVFLFFAWLVNPVFGGIMAVSYFYLTSPRKER